MSTTESERACITQHEQKEYDSISWDNDDFGKIKKSTPFSIFNVFFDFLIMIIILNIVFNNC